MVKMQVSEKRLYVILGLALLGILGAVCAPAAAFDDTVDSVATYKVSNHIGTDDQFYSVYITYTYEDGTEFTAFNRLEDILGPDPVPSGSRMISNVTHITNTTVAVDIKPTWGFMGVHYCHHVHQFTADRYVPNIDITADISYKVNDPDDTTVTVNGVSNTLRGGGNRDILTTKSTFGNPGADNSLITYHLAANNLGSNDPVHSMYISYTYDDGTVVPAVEFDSRNYGVLTRLLTKPAHITNTTVAVDIWADWGFMDSNHCDHVHRFTADRYVPNVDITVDSLYNVGGPDDTTVTVNGISNVIKGGRDGEIVYGYSTL